MPVHPRLHDVGHGATAVVWAEVRQPLADRGRIDALHPNVPQGDRRDGISVRRRETG